MIKGSPPVALIAGPTASGKSALAVALAERASGVVINADSAQVYADLAVLSARPRPEEMRSVEHRLYGTRDAALPCSAADWAAEAREAIAEAHAAGKLPILTGGTGLYLRTLLDGIAPVPPIDPRIREEVRASDTETNRQRLRHADPEAFARLKPQDTTRIARALEVALSTGRTLRSWQEAREGGIGESIDLQALILLPPRQWLYDRCDERFATMMEGGAIEEVRVLLSRQLDSALPAMRAIGVAEVRDLLSGEITEQEALRRGQQATRNYAKRQYTWFAHQPPPDWPRFPDALDSPGVTERALALLHPKR
ncbi:tRNA (adenosine(37)-N6)-dimethylallyltransferase MiaA [Sphingomonas arenae]|uniref:tRNA (adenosine(37)-N6)-dimethylallyltransferase MiaA n=1 Tax=Sphingomonas arenae TaxID=2812555 RepID=UPI0019679330|nr:tRNA (adenosine(37)-N6)-dimethylallyltransferase MiaA [Sphingomonas arenae]